MAVFSPEAIVKIPQLEIARLNVSLRIKVDSDSVRANVPID